MPSSASCVRVEGTCYHVTWTVGNTHLAKFGKHFLESFCLPQMISCICIWETSWYIYGVCLQYKFRQKYFWIFCHLNDPYKYFAVWFAGYFWHCLYCKKLYAKRQMYKSWSGVHLNTSKSQKPSFPSSCQSFGRLLAATEFEWVISCQH